MPDDAPEVFIARTVEFVEAHTYGHGRCYAGPVRAHGWLKVGMSEMAVEIDLTWPEIRELRRILNAAGRRVMGEIAGKVAARLEGET